MDRTAAPPKAALGASKVKRPWAEAFGTKRRFRIEPPPPEWVVPRLTIIIATQERSGSNYLCDLMAQTGRLGRPGEYFSPSVLSKHYPGRGRVPADSCLLTREEGMSPNGVLSFKLFPDHFLRLQGGIRLSEWFGEPRWIWLRRRDRIGQAISFDIASQTGSFTSHQPAVGEPVFNRRRLLALLALFAQRDGKWEAFFARNSIDPLCLWYEDIISDGVGTVGLVGDYLGVDLTGVEVVPGKGFERQTTDLNQRWRERFLSETSTIDRLELPGLKTRGVLRKMRMQLELMAERLVAARRVAPPPNSPGLDRVPPRRSG